MSKYEQWKSAPARFRAMTGYDLSHFDKLLPCFSEEHQEYFSYHNLKGKPHKKGFRKFVIYRNSPLPTVEERLVFILSYLKLNPLQEQHADTFGMEQRQCNDFVHGLKTVLDRSLKRLGAMPVSTGAELEKVLEEQGEEAAPDRQLFHDGTEREIPRPSAPALQEENYSGKKKKHTVKNAVVTNMVGLVLLLTSTVAGKVHDKKIADDHYTVKAGHFLWQDTGYQGYAPDGVTVVQPTKKPRGKELSEEQKAKNKEISSVRVRVEHFIGSIKRMRIVKDECRLRKEGVVSSIMKTCTGLHNLRVIMNPFNYPEIKLT